MDKVDRYEIHTTCQSIDEALPSRGGYEVRFEGQNVSINFLALPKFKTGDKIKIAFETRGD